jgi:hypothetical protein
MGEQVQPIDLWCPNCRAVPQEPCRSLRAAGKTKKTVHVGRAELARAANTGGISRDAHT